MPLDRVADNERVDRTDKAVLAVNGFAADGNMFVQKVQQRLEVCFIVFNTSYFTNQARRNYLYIIMSPIVVPSRTRQRDATTGNSQAHSDYALRKAILPLLRLQYSRWY